jgi:hypothetical protein
LSLGLYLHSKCEVHAGTRHPKVIIFSVDDIPVEVAYHPDVWRQAHFQAAAKLADSLRSAPGTNGGHGIYTMQNCGLLAAAKYRSAAGEDIRSEPGTTYRVTKGKRAENCANRALIVVCSGKVSSRDIDKNKVRVGETLTDVEGIALNADPKVSREEELPFESATPSMIGIQVTIMMTRGTVD